MMSRLRDVLASIEGDLAIAVSGGVDSMTLATAAQRWLPGRARMFHAISAAVPPAATQRVRDFAKRESWDLVVIDAGELDDPDYLANPADRCYFCKRGLYGGIIDALKEHGAGQILAGTNLDDLGDFRPGLRAAKERGVRHPFVEAHMPKAEVRALAGELGLADLAKLPAAPCLASRVETGLAIEPRQLRAIDRVERIVCAELEAAGLTPSAVRCRVRPLSIELAINTECLDLISPTLRAHINKEAISAWGPDTPILEWRAYEMGQSFLANRAMRKRYRLSISQ